MAKNELMVLMVFAMFFATFKSELQFFIDLHIYKAEIDPNMEANELLLKIENCKKNVDGYLKESSNLLKQCEDYQR